MRITESWRLKNERYALKCPVDIQVGMNETFPPRLVKPKEVELYDFSNNRSEEIKSLAQAVVGVASQEKAVA